MRLCRIASLALVVVVSGTLVGAQRQSPPPTNFNQLDCTFTASAAATWEAAKPRISVQRRVPLELRIGNVDLTRGTAEFTFGAMRTAATLIQTGSVVHVIQPPENGTIAMASIELAGGRPAQFRASYSRTEYYSYNGPGFVSTPHVDQHYGYCRPAPN